MISVVYAISEDRDYALITLVSIFSVIKNCNKEQIKFYILIDQNFSADLKTEMNNFVKTKNNDAEIIEFVDVGSLFDGVSSHINHIKKATFYRLLIPEIIPEDKCIYLDSDTIVCRDLVELWSFDLKNNYVAGVKAPWYHIEAEEQNYSEQAHIKDLSNYINAGVLLMNLKLMREDKVVDKFIELLPFNMISQDQDIINSVCYERIVFLPFKYNLMIKYASWSIEKYSKLFLDENLFESWNSPIIIHYADPKKPWNNINGVLAQYWWQACYESGLWKYFMNRSADNIFYDLFVNSENKNKEISCVSDEMYLRCNRKVAVFGAGNYAKRILNYLESIDSSPDFFVVSNLEKNPKEIKGISVLEINELNISVNEYVLVLAMRSELQRQVFSLVKGMNFKRIISLNNTILEGNEYEG